MHQQATQAYQQVAKRTASPRDLEATLLTKSAGNLQRIRDDWDGARGDLYSALKFNRKLWTVFMSSVTRDDSPLPQSIRQNIANLGMFVMNHSIKLEANPQASRLSVLININREIAAGLRAANAG